MIDFAKHKKGDVVSVHCCNSCTRIAGLTPRVPATKGTLVCEVCGHYGIGSLVDCEVGDWLQLRPIRVNRTGGGVKKLAFESRTEKICGNCIHSTYEFMFKHQATCILDGKVKNEWQNCDVEKVSDDSNH